MEQRWIPVSERLPDADKYILVSIENFIISDIGRYETDKDGSGAFYPGDDGKSYVEYGLFVNAWMPLPEPYRESEEEVATIQNYDSKQTNADRIRSMTDEELATNMMRPNENGLAEIDCDKNDNCNCYECLLKWLKAENEE